jgi:hypothetical protein
VATFALGLVILANQAFWAREVQAELVSAAVLLLLAPAAARVDDAVKARRREEVDHD